MPKQRLLGSPPTQKSPQKTKPPVSLGQMWLLMKWMSNRAVGSISLATQDAQTLTHPKLVIDPTPLLPNQTELFFCQTMFGQNGQIDLANAVNFCRMFGRTPSHFGSFFAECVRGLVDH